jgi:uncharacterized protein YdeI (YjbR/CyaY-like superfamily)
MGKKDPRFDAYIAKSAPFAQPILKHLRKLVHTACPDVEEDLKWSSPTFMYKGILCGMAAFKEHAVFGFWKHKLIFGTSPGSKDAMGSFGRLTSLKDLPSDTVLSGLVKKAMEINDAGLKVARPKRKERAPLKTPGYFMAALRKNKKALATFEGFGPSNKREYVEWITDAKTGETRLNRLKTAVEWIAQGKVRNWKYIK